ncbi:MAG: hypothetical protein ABI661_05705 [Gammaproteobacteria bacterium]
MANKTSQHILNTSANLLGFCLFVITSLHIADRLQSTLIDELTTVVAVMLAISSFLSFLSIRTDDAARERSLELIADYVFMGALTGILATILLITLSVLQ